jgi:hypothetical protein
VKIDFEKAKRAATQLARKLGSPDWLLGVGIDTDAREGFVLSIRVTPGAANLAKLAPRFAGVRVHVIERQHAKSLEARRNASS